MQSEVGYHGLIANTSRRRQNVITSLLVVLSLYSPTDLSAIGSQARSGRAPSTTVTATRVIVATQHIERGTRIDSPAKIDQYFKAKRVSARSIDGSRTPARRLKQLRHQVAIEDIAKGSIVYLESFDFVEDLHLSLGRQQLLDRHQAGIAVTRPGYLYAAVTLVCERKLIENRSWRDQRVVLVEARGRSSLEGQRRYTAPCVGLLEMKPPSPTAIEVEAKYLLCLNEVEHKDLMALIGRGAPFRAIGFHLLFVPGAARNYRGSK